jgi:hypothetical protein
MTETEPFASHIDGLAYSCEDVVDYPEPEVRSWYDTGVAAVGVFALVAGLVAAVFIWGLPATQHMASPDTSVRPPATLTPPAVTLPPPVIAPPPQAAPTEPPTTPSPPPSAKTADNPDVVFARSWNEQMPAFTFTDQYCVDNGARPGCWLQLESTNPSNAEFIFLGRARCDYLRSNPRLTIGDAASDIRRVYRDVTIDQSNEITTLAVRSYCPQYS